MLMLMLWDANACLTPKGVTPTLSGGRTRPRFGDRALQSGGGQLGEK
jgi:hypothetical protein